MKKLLTERFQELAGIRPLYQLNENTAVAFIGNGKVVNVIGDTAKTEENSSKFQSIANGGDVRFSIHYQWLSDVGTFEIFVAIGDNSKLEYRVTSKGNGPSIEEMEPKAIEFTEYAKNEIVRSVERILGYSHIKEHLGKIHIGMGYEDKITDEDVTRLKAGFEKFKTVKAIKL